MTFFFLAIKNFFLKIFKKQPKKPVNTVDRLAELHAEIVRLVSRYND